MKKCILFIFVYIIRESAEGQENGVIQKYGAYAVHLKKLEPCVVSNWVNASDVQFKILDAKLAKIFINYAFYTSVKIESSRVEIYRQTEKNVRVPFWRYNVNKPCDHFLTGPIIKMMTNNTNCLLNKGKLSFTIDINSVMKKMFGPSLFYGDFYGKTMFKSKKGTFLCSVTEIELVPVKANQTE